MGTETQMIRKIIKEVISEVDARMPCKVDADTFIKHEKLLTEISTNMKSISDTQVETKQLIEKLFTKADANAGKIATLEGNKETMIWAIGIIAPLLGAIGAFIMEKVL